MLCGDHWFMYSLDSSYFGQIVQMPVVDDLRTRETRPDFSRGFVSNLPSELG
jgi:hypothetical protein